MREFNLDIRHTCEHDDNIAGYAWQKHDGREFGSQTISDKLNNVMIKTEFVKDLGGQHGCFDSFRW